VYEGGVKYDVKSIFLLDTSHKFPVSVTSLLPSHIYISPTFSYNFQHKFVVSLASFVMSE
jgi:hypothetical protein